MSDSLLIITGLLNAFGETDINVTASQSKYYKGITYVKRNSRSSKQAKMKISSKTRANNCIFNLTVEAVNDAPVILSFAPVDSLIIVDELQDIDFSVLVNDIDNSFENLEFTWFVNSEAQTETDSTFTYSVNSSGDIEIKTIVFDGAESDSTVWTVRSTASITDEMIPVRTNLHQNYPNPFNPATTINYDLKEQGQVKILVYNTNGSLVRTLIDGNQKAGYHSISWNGRDNNGRSVSSGLYIYKMNAGGFNKVLRAMMVK